jgi:hypothetical protein
LSSDGCAKKRMVPLRGARFTWEVADRRSFFAVFLR